MYCSGSKDLVSCSVRMVDIITVKQVNYEKYHVESKEENSRGTACCAEIPGMDKDG